LLTGRPFTINVPTDHFADVDGDQLAFASTLADGSALPGWLTFDGATYSGRAPFNAAGSYDIILRASDGQAEASDVFTLTIGQGTQLLEAHDDGGFAVAAPDILDIDLTTLLANDANVDPDTVALVAVTSGANGSVQVTDDYISYIPELDFRGTDQFTYTISDGTDTSTATVSVTVSNPILDALEQQGGAAQFDQSSLGGLVDSNFGTSGNDRMIGDTGSDVLEGAAGDDLLRGGAGSDSLRGGTGDDVLFGGDGRDSFYFAEGDGSDRIYDFDVSRAGRRSFIAGDEIKLSVSDIDSFEDLVAIGSDQDGGVLFDFGNGDELFLAGTQLAALDKDQFSFY
jgi:Ca2+-binding RTX toxin-like protein